MAEVCAWCGREMDVQSRRGGRVRTNQGLICEECTPAYFKSLSDPESAPPPRPEVRRAEPSPSPAEPKGDFAQEPEAAEEEEEPPREAPPPPPDADEHPSTEGPAEAQRSPAPPEEEPEEDAGPDPFGLLEDIRRQVGQIRQSVAFESTSAWNVFGAVAQTFALAALLFAGVTWASGPMDMLLVAILLQLMALTFFLNGK